MSILPEGNLEVELQPVGDGVEAALIVLLHRPAVGNGSREAIAHSVIEALPGSLQTGMEAKSTKGRKSKDNVAVIPEAIRFLQGISAALTDRKKELSAGSPLTQWQDAGRAASEITECIQKQMEGWERAGEDYRISYSKAREVGCAMIRPRYKKRLREALQERNPLHATEDAD